MHNTLDAQKNNIWYKFLKLWKWTCILCISFQNLLQSKKQIIKDMSLIVHLSFFFAYIDFNESGVTMTTASYICPACKKPVWTSIVVSPSDIVIINSAVDSPVFVRENEMFVPSFSLKSPIYHNIMIKNGNSGQ